jgi:hypothetical protein
VFEEVVGPLQPILAEMPRIFRRVARGEMELAEARQRLDAVAQEQPRSPIAALEHYVQNEIADTTQGQGKAPLITQDKLAAWALAHPAPGMRIMAVPEPGATHVVQDGTRGCLAIVWAYVPPHLGIESTEEILATFSGEVADRHPPTAPAQGDEGIQGEGMEGVRLLTWGDPYLMAWLEAVRGDPLTDDDYKCVGLVREANPFDDA